MAEEKENEAKNEGSGGGFCGCEMSVGKSIKFRALSLCRVFYMDSYHVCVC